MLTVSQAAARMGVDRSRIYRWYTQGVSVGGLAEEPIRLRVEHQPAGVRISEAALAEFCLLITSVRAAHHRRVGQARGALRRPHGLAARQFDEARFLSFAAGRGYPPPRGRLDSPAAPGRAARLAPVARTPAG